MDSILDLHRSEANNNAGIAAAEQIHRFFKDGDVKFQLNK